MKELSTSAKAKKAAEEWERLQDSRKIKKIITDITQEAAPKNDDLTHGDQEQTELKKSQKTDKGQLLDSA
ncbi:hypothetical protein [Maribacter sp. 2-571]|uniref:hypothetical protein n=1 Tax=Maribacter sp. 2-571 TaxID=3417569 RepID=UPI003D32FE71